jgi:hypothetical protein
MPTHTRGLPEMLYHRVIGIDECWFLSHYLCVVVYEALLLRRGQIACI